MTNPNRLNVIRDHKIVTGLVIGALAFGAYEGEALINGGGDAQGVLRPSAETAGMSPRAALSHEIISQFNVKPDVTCQNKDGLDITTANFSVDGKNVTVVQPDIQRGHLKFSDAIANAFESNTSQASKEELYTSFCENAYLTTATAAFMSNIELPNGKTIGQEVDWLKPYGDMSQVDNIAEDRSALTQDQITNDPAKTIEGLQANEALAAKLIQLFENFKYEGIDVSRTIQNVHVPLPDGVRLPEVAYNKEQMKAKGLLFTLTYKNSAAANGDNSGTKVLCVMFNQGDKRPETVTCQPGQKHTIVLPPEMLQPKIPPRLRRHVPPHQHRNPHQIIRPKHDDGRLPGNPNVPADQGHGTPDKPGHGPAGQQPGSDGYVPGETKPPAQPQKPQPQPQPTPNQSPAETGPEPGNLDPNGSATVPGTNNDTSKGGPVDPGSL